MSNNSSNQGDNKNSAGNFTWNPQATNNVFGSPPPQQVAPSGGFGLNTNPSAPAGGNVFNSPPPALFGAPTVGASAPAWVPLNLPTPSTAATAGPAPLSFPFGQAPKPLNSDLPWVATPVPAPSGGAPLASAFVWNPRASEGSAPGPTIRTSSVTTTSSVDVNTKRYSRHMLTELILKRVSELNYEGRTYVRDFVGDVELQPRLPGLKGHGLGVHSVVEWCPGNNRFLAVGNREARILIWDIAHPDTPYVQGLCSQHANDGATDTPENDLSVQLLVLSNGLLVSACRDILTVWGCSPTRQFGSLRSFVVGNERGCSVRWMVENDEGRVVLETSDGTFQIWEVSVPTESPCMLEIEFPAGAQCVWLGEERFVVHTPSFLKLYSLRDHRLRELDELEGHKGVITTVLPLSEARMLTFAKDQQLRVWWMPYEDDEDEEEDEDNDRRAVKVIGEYAERITCPPVVIHDTIVAIPVQLHIRGQTLYEIHLWDIGDGSEPVLEPRLSIQGHTSPIMSLSLSEDRSLLLSLGQDRSVRVVDLSHGLDGVGTIQVIDHPFASRVDETVLEVESESAPVTDKQEVPSLTPLSDGRVAIWSAAMSEVVIWECRDYDRR